MIARVDTPVISAGHLTRRFRTRAAVDRLDLAVDSGEIFGLVGPDGAGKTTVIRMLAAVIAPTGGRASVLGHDVVHAAAQLRRAVGYMAQRFRLYGDLSVEENLDFFADIFGVAGGSAGRGSSGCWISRLDDSRAGGPADLSGGMQKKLALACTLVHQPEIVFLDEPTTGVDPVSRREFWDILRGLHLQGITIVVSTPYMDEAERCSRVGLFYAGRIVDCDAAAPSWARGARSSCCRRRPSGLPRAPPGRGRLPGVLEVQTYGDLLHVFVDDAATARIRASARRLGRGRSVRDIRRAAAHGRHVHLFDPQSRRQGGCSVRSRSRFVTERADQAFGGFTAVDHITSGCRAARSSASSAPTARARRPPSGCSWACSGRPGRAPSWATTAPADAAIRRRRATCRSGSACTAT